MPDAELTFPGETRSVSAARRFTTSTLTGWGADEYVFPAVTVVAELCGNAALHARTAFTVTLTLDGAGLRVGVSDHSMLMPRRRRYSLEATTGRGLALVAAVSQHWGVTTGERGKTVWAQIDARSAAGLEPSVDLFSTEIADLLGTSQPRSASHADGDVLARAA